MTASPRRAPIENTWARTPGGVLYIRAWGADFAVARYLRNWLDTVEGEYESLSARKIVLPNGIELETKAEHIHRYIDYEFKSKEKDWQIPMGNMGHSDHEVDPNSEARVVESLSRRAKRAAKTGSGERESGGRDTTPRISGAVTLKALCEELGVEPRHARAALRKKLTTRPKRWEWEKDDNALETVRKIVKEAKK